MTINKFNHECEKRTIHPSIALENDNIQQALQDRNDQLVLQLLDKEF